MWDDGPVGAFSLSLSPSLSLSLSLAHPRTVREIDIAPAQRTPKAVYRLKSRENRSHPLLCNITALSSEIWADFEAFSSFLYGV